MGKPDPVESIGEKIALLLMWAWILYVCFFLYQIVAVLLDEAPRTLTELYHIVQQRVFK